MHTRPCPHRLMPFCTPSCLGCPPALCTNVHAGCARACCDCHCFSSASNFSNACCIAASDDLTCMGTPHAYTQIKPPPLRPPHLDLSSLPRLPCSLPHSHSPTGTRMHTRAQAHSRAHACPAACAHSTHRNTETQTQTQTRTQTGPPARAHTVCVQSAEVLARVRSECRGMRVPDCECAISHYLQPCVCVCVCVRV